VLVGEAATFLEDLAGVGFDGVEVLSVSELDLFLRQGTAQATRDSPLLAP